MKELLDTFSTKNTVIYYCNYNDECNILNNNLRQFCENNNIIYAELIEEKKSVDSSINFLNSLCENELKVIITTQSPFIIGNFSCNKDNVLLKYKDGSFYKSESAYGLDYNTILEDFFDVSPRDSTIDILINGYVLLFNKKKYGEASNLFVRLKEYMGFDENEELPVKLQESINSRLNL